MKTPVLIQVSVKLKIVGFGTTASEFQLIDLKIWVKQMEQKDL